MQDFKTADPLDIDTIRKVLLEATKRPHSGDLLNDFPWESTLWYSAKFEDSEFENLYLLWDGSAWKECSPLPRIVSKGLRDFKRLKRKSRNQWTRQLIDLVDYTPDSDADQQSLLILISKCNESPLMILDGNHRAVSFLCQAYKAGSRVFIPTCAWVGISPQMASYPQYARISERLQNRKTSV